MASKKEAPRGATPRKEKTPRQWNVRLPRIQLQWLLLPVFVVGLAAVGHWGYHRWPVTAVEVQGRLSIWQPKTIAEQLMWVKEHSFFSLDLVQVRRQIEQLPLITQVVVRKRWPGTVEVTLFEDVPVAVWNGDQLLSARGQLSAIPEGLSLDGLAHMEGHRDNAEMAVRYFRRIQQLLAGQAVQVSRLAVTQTGSVQAELSNGWSVEFGRQYFEERVQRLALLMQKLPQDAVQTVDLRYGKGAAIAWRQGKEMES